MKPNFKTKALCSAIALAGLTMAGGGVQAAEYWLRATPMTATLNGTAVAMWGYQDCTSAGSFDLAACPVTTAWAPGPKLVVGPSDALLTVNLQNNLPEPTSLLIPGLPKAMAPVFFAGDPLTGATSGSRTSPAQRVRSFDAEAGTDGVPTVYTWPARPGTYLYHSGTHPQVQVQMGLYGVVAKDASAAVGAIPAEAYPGVSKDADLTLLFSEVEPTLHAAVAANDYGPGPGKSMTSTLFNTPSWFLVNGLPYVPGTTPNLGVDDANIALDGNKRTRVRLVNAGLHTHVPTFNNATLRQVAEDGKISPFAAMEQYHINLPPLKTVDAILVGAPGVTDVAIYDRHLSTTNPVQTTDSYGVPIQASVPGGMFTKLVMLPAGGAATPPAAPTLNSAVANSATQVTLGWSDNALAPNNEQGYNILRNGVQIGTTAADVASYVDTTVSAGTTYQYQVTAFNANGTATSTPLSVTTPITVTLAAATAVSAQMVNPTTVELKFTDNSTNESGYRVQRCVGGNTTCSSNSNNWQIFSGAVSLTQVGSTVTAVFDQTPANGTNRYRVAALNGSVVGAASADQTANRIILSSNPAAPTRRTPVTSLGAVGSGSVTLYWNDNANNAALYRIQRCGPAIGGVTPTTCAAGTTANPNPNWTDAQQVNGNLNTAAVVGLTTGRRYQLRIRAESGYGRQSAWVYFPSGTAGSSYVTAP